MIPQFLALISILRGLKTIGSLWESKACRHHTIPFIAFDSFSRLLVQNFPVLHSKTCPLVKSPYTQRWLKMSSGCITDQVINLSLVSGGPPRLYPLFLYLCQPMENTTSKGILSTYSNSVPLLSPLKINLLCMEGRITHF